MFDCLTNAKSNPSAVFIAQGPILLNMWKKLATFIKLGDKMEMIIISERFDKSCQIRMINLHQSFQFSLNPIKIAIFARYRLYRNFCQIFACCQLLNTLKIFTTFGWSFIVLMTFLWFYRKWILAFFRQLRIWRNNRCCWSDNSIGASSYQIGEINPVKTPNVFFFANFVQKSKLLVFGVLRCGFDNHMVLSQLLVLIFVDLFIHFKLLVIWSCLQILAIFFLIWNGWGRIGSLLKIKSSGCRWYHPFRRLFYVWSSNRVRRRWQKLDSYWRFFFKNFRMQFFGIFECYLFILVILLSGLVLQLILPNVQFRSNRVLIWSKWEIFWPWIRLDDCNLGIPLFLFFWRYTSSFRFI